MSSPPATLGQYQIIREIARSNDIVYEAYDPLMNRRVAVKELAMPHGSTPQQQEDRISRFKREAQAAGTLNHPNIMTVYSFAEDAGRTFMAMEFLDGQTLRNEIDTKGALSPNRAVEIAAEVLAGLSHAHSKGVIHRDIKPDNIQILSNGTIKITDFGIARLTFQPNLTVDGQVFGTPSYMSPEQVIGRDIDARSDIFSVGVMLYEMLTGNKPFSGDSVVSTTYAIMNKDPEQPPKMSWPMWSVISRALEKSPALRYANAQDMRQALMDAIDPGAGAMPLVDPTLPPGYQPSANPYAPPPLPFMGMAAAPPPSPIQAPYNPYAPPGASANPYAGQYAPSGPQPPPSPLTYPYNPYAAGGGTAPPHTQGALDPYGQPITAAYFPPPPRRPLIKPETWIFIKKLTVALIIFGTFFTLLYVGISSFFEQLSRTSGVREREQYVQQHLDQAKKAINSPDPAGPPTAELELQAAHDKDPQNPEVNVQLAQLYYEQAQKSTDIEKMATLYLRSSNSYGEAAEGESNPSKQKQDGVSSATAAYNAASDALQVDNDQLKRDARAALAGAKDWVQSDATMTQQIKDLLDKIRV